MTPPAADFGAESAARPIDLATSAPFRLGALEVRPSMRQVRAGARSVTAEPRVLQVLIALAEADGAVASRDGLVQRCWDGRIIGDDAINRAIAKARLLAELTDPPAFAIETIPRVGYRLVVGNTDEAAADASRPAQPVSPGAAGDRTATGIWRKPRGALLAIAAGTILVLSGVLVWSRLSAPPPYLTAVRTFAVSGESASLGQSLADRVAAEINDRQLPVVSRDRTRRGDLHGAHYVVGGEVHRIGDSMRVDVRLDDDRSGLNLWTQTITRPLADADGLQDQVADTVADRLDLTRRWLGPHGDDIKPAALAALIRATDAMRGGRATLIETREGFRRFRDLAPDLAVAHASFAMATASAATAQPADTAAAWRSEARQEAQRALAIDPKNSEAYKVLGFLTPDLVQRQAWYMKGLSVDPNDSNLCAFYGNLLLDVGRTHEGLVWQDRALKLDPLSPPKTGGLIRALAIAGRFSDAAAMVPRAEKLWPQDIPLQRLIVLTNLIDAAPAQASAALEGLQASAHPMAADHAAAWRAYEATRARGVDRLGAERSLAAVASTAEGEELNSLIAALASLGDRDDAFRLMEQGGASADRWSTSILFQSATASLRTDPRFAAVAEQFGLTRYWRMTGKQPDVSAAASER